MSERGPDRLFKLLPDHHRARDAEGERSLEALMRLLAAELEVVEGDIDQLYDNWFIETCEPWVIPYIGALVGARPLRPFGEGGGGLRPYVANTLSYRQSKGSAAALEQLVRDVTGWSAVGVEFFQRVVRSQNVNHVRPEGLGSVSIHDSEAARATGGPFERATHTAAAGPITGSGRYNLANVGFFSWRLQAFAIGFLSGEAEGYSGGVQPRVSELGRGFRRIDPLGRDLHLFNRPRADVDLEERTSARNVPAPLDRRVLYLDLEALRGGQPGGGDWFQDGPAFEVRLSGRAVPPRRLHSCDLQEVDDGTGTMTWRRPAVAGHVHVDPERGRISLHPDDEEDDVEVAYAYGAAGAVGAGPYDRSSSAESWKQRVFIAGQSPPFRMGVSTRSDEVTDDPDRGGPVVADLESAIARWNAQARPGSRGIITVLDNASYAATDPTTPAAIGPVEVPEDAILVIVASGWPSRDDRGAIRRDPTALAPSGRRPHVRANFAVVGTAPESADAGSLILDGLMVEGEITIREGGLGELQLRHCTVGASASRLELGVRVESGNEPLRLVVDHTILGRVDLGRAAGGVELRDSILGEDRPGDNSSDSDQILLRAEASDLAVAQSTVFGGVVGRTVQAENSIFGGHLQIARRQTGCVRFSYLPLSSRVPTRYRCMPDLLLAREARSRGGELTDDEERALVARSQPTFISSEFGPGHFAMLSLGCPQAIAEGGEGGAAMGVGFRHGEPFRRANFDDALKEYLPFGLDAAPIFMT